ncbi:MAG: hypothetical protein ACOYKM_00755 [Caulobacterales bacterium]|jgi:hypothetical protein
MGKVIEQTGVAQSSTKRKTLRVVFPRRFAELPELEVTFSCSGASRSVRPTERSARWFEVSPFDAASVGKLVDRPCTLTWTARGEVLPAWHGSIAPVSLTAGLLGVVATLNELGVIDATRSALARFLAGL